MSRLKEVSQRKKERKKERKTQVILNLAAVVIFYYRQICYANAKFGAEP
jgi:hypothetical protein